MSNKQCNWDKVENRQVVQRQCLLAFRLSLETEAGQPHAHLWNKRINLKNTYKTLKCIPEDGV